MIKINEEIAKECADLHFKACKPYVENRLNFLIDLFDAVSKRNYIVFQNTSDKEKELRTKYSFHDISSIRSFLSPIAKNDITYDEIFLILEKGETSSLKPSKCQISKILKSLHNVINDLEALLIGKPNVLKKYTTADSKAIQKEFKELIESIFSYEKLGKPKGEAFGLEGNWNTYSLTKALEIHICLYCNKNWINTVYDENGDKVTNPQLDHFFSKSEFPILRLSFYNLIPSCETCNARIKKNKELDIERHIHPYLEGFDPEQYIAPIPLDSESTCGVGSNYLITLDSDEDNDKLKRSQNSFDFFHIDDVYEQHGDIISEIYFKRTKYNLTAIQDLLNHDMFQGMTIEEAYRFVFANYYSIDDYNKRPFSKLTRDTLRSLGII